MLGNPNGASASIRLKRRRISPLADSASGSDSNNDQRRPNPTLKKIKHSRQLSDDVIRSRCLLLAQLNPQFEREEVRAALKECDYDIPRATRHLREKSAHQKEKCAAKREKEKAAKSRKRDSGDSSESNEDNSNIQVYDSDDSDVEVSGKVSGMRRKVFEFLGNSSCEELQNVKTISEKKANLLIELRPFSNWAQLLKKLEASKLSTDILNYTHELINKQNNVVSILTKCNDLVARLEKAIANGAGISEQPRLLTQSLKLADYQMIGLNWLAVMHHQAMNGILADEMGLGKTIQVIAFLAYLKEHKLSRGAHLIVVPPSTLDNWEAEIAKWCPSLVVEKYQGDQAERRRMRVRYAKEDFTGFDVLLTTYRVVSATPEERKMFRVCKLHYVIFDEAHMLKNMMTQRYTHLITVNAKMRILLTGTPLQNNLLELMSLLCFVMPKMFGKNIDDIKSLFGKKPKADLENEGRSQFQEAQVEQAKRIMKPFVLRRFKNDVLKKLPRKTTTIETVPMSVSQRKYYNELVAYYSENKEKICSGERAGITVMTEMRKIANHPLLMRYYFSDDQLRGFAERLSKNSSYKKTNAQYIFEELAILSDFKIWQLCAKHELTDVSIPDKLVCDSGKFKYLDKLLPKLKLEGHRVLLFSQYTMMLDIVEEYLAIRDFGFCRLDGNTAVVERQDLINEYNSNPNIFIFLLSTRAAGIGINLTAADTCIIHDIDYNPYNDKQAEDRCHRLGQTKPVTIYRLISQSTIEEGILLAAEEKLKLEQDITSDTGEAHEQRCVVKLLSTALGLDKSQADKLNSSLTAISAE